MGYEVEPLEQEQKSPNLKRDVACIRCGYNLKGVDRHGTCPECGMFVEHSLRGTMLPDSDPDYVRSLHRGAVTVLTCLVASLAVGILTFAVGVTFAVMGGMAASAPTPAGAPPAAGPGGIPEWIELASLLAQTGIGLASVFGWWLLTSPDPGGASRENSPKVRLAVRVLAVCAAVASLVAFMSTLLWGPANALALGGGGITPGEVIVILAGVVSGFLLPIARFFVELVYIRALARRIPDTLIAERAKKLMWVYPLIYVLGALCLGLGPLIALILYYRLINSVRKALREIMPQERYLDSRPMSA